MNSKFLRYATALLVLATLFQSCKKDDNQTTLKEYANGVYISNEGAFQNGTGSISFWSRDNQVRDNNIYQNANGIPLGNIVNTIAVHAGHAYIVVNNAGKIEVADAKSLAQKGSITGLLYPRYFVGLNDNKGYVTEWLDAYGSFTGHVSVINLATNMIVKSIDVGIAPENMALVGDKLYVVNSADSTISVINTNTDVVENTITVGDYPNSIQTDANGDVWVMCGGKPSWTTNPTAAKLVKFNPATPAVQTAFGFDIPGKYASHLVINGAKNKLYYTHKQAVYQFDITASALDTVAIIKRDLYSLGVDPVTGNLYGADAGDYASVGKVIKYGTDYHPIDSLSTDIVPGNFWFVN